MKGKGKNTMSILEQYQDSIKNPDKYRKGKTFDEDDYDEVDGGYITFDPNFKSPTAYAEYGSAKTIPTKSKEVFTNASIRLANTIKAHCRGSKEALGMALLMRDQTKVILGKMNDDLMEEDFDDLLMDMNEAVRILVHENEASEASPIYGKSSMIGDIKIML